MKVICSFNDCDNYVCVHKYFHTENYSCVEFCSLKLKNVKCISVSEIRKIKLKKINESNL